MKRSSACKRGLGAPGRPQRCILAAGLALVLGSSAQALEMSPVGGISAPGGRRRPISAFLGVSVGHDSNALREEPGDADGDAVTELLAGIVLSYAKDLNKYELKYQLRARDYSEPGHPGFDESRTLLGVHVGSGTFRLRLRGEHSLLAEPTEIEIRENLERTRIGYVLEPEMTFGRSEVGLGYHGRTMEYDEAAGYPDSADSALRAEFRWRCAEERKDQVFAHLDLGSADSHSEFSYQRLYAGWRTESPGESGIEIGVGANILDDFTSDPGLSETDVFALIRYRSVLPPRAGRAAIEVAYVRSTEAAATADFKTVSRLLLRYSEAVTERLGWSAGISAEKADFTNPDLANPAFPASESLFFFALDAGLRLDMGSAKWGHGQLYSTLRYEMRTGDSGADDYYRLALLAGVAFVY